MEDLISETHWRTLEVGQTGLTSTSTPSYCLHWWEFKCSYCM